VIRPENITSENGKVMDELIRGSFIEVTGMILIYTLLKEGQNFSISA
jgi:hypothetical protein